MKSISTLTGLVATLNRANVDTDAIIPKQYLKSIHRTGFGQYIFDEWRYLGDSRTPNPDFELNQPRYQGASILLTQGNFGCGSSREHAPWGLLEYGFQVIIAPSFADIFYHNCLKNGILPITLSQSTIDVLFQAVYANPGYQLTIDLTAKKVTAPTGEEWVFEIADSAQKKLLAGLDDIDLTLQYQADIAAFEAARKKTHPWLFKELS